MGILMLPACTAVVLIYHFRIYRGTFGKTRYLGKNAYVDMETSPQKQQIIVYAKFARYF